MDSVKYRSSPFVLIAGLQGCANAPYRVGKWSYDRRMSLPDHGPSGVAARRITAAAEGDFVIAFYNPVSKRRRRQFDKACAILRAHRAPQTPVIIARNLGRDEEEISVVALQELETDSVDMLTVVIVGSSETRIIPGAGRPVRVYTPRGYGDKIP